MGKKKSHSTGGGTEPTTPSLAHRLGTHFTIAAAVIVTDVGVGLMFGSGESTWTGVAGIIVHALAIGAVVFVWLPLSAWLAGWVRLPEVAAEGLMIVVLGFLVAGVELGLLRGPDRVAQTVVGMLARWAMRIEPLEPEESSQ